MEQVQEAIKTQKKKVPGSAANQEGRAERDRSVLGSGLATYLAQLVFVLACSCFFSVAMPCF